MPTFPQIPTPRFYSEHASGKGTRDSATLWGGIAQRSAWIERNAMRIGGWAQGTTGVVAGEQTVGLGDFLAVVEPHTEGLVRVWLVITATTGAVTYRAGAQQAHGATNGGLLGALGSVSTFDDTASVTTSGVYAIDLDLSAFPPGPVIFWAKAISTDATADHVVESICIVARPDTNTEGETIAAAPPTAWPVTSIDHAGDDDTPDDAATLARLRDAQATIAGRAPRVLASRTLGVGYEVPASGIAAGDNTAGAGYGAVYHYVVWRGNETGAATLAFNATDGDAIGISIEVYVDALTDTTAQQSAPTVPQPAISPAGAFVPGTATEVVASTEVGVTSAWQTAELAGCWTANTYHLVQVVFRSDWQDGTANFGAGEVYALALSEDEYAVATYLASGDAMPAGPRVPSYVTDQPIVASYDGGEVGSHNDRRTLAATTAWQGWRRSQLLAMDSPYAPVGAAGVSVAATAGGDPLWYGRHRLSRGASGLEVWAQVRRLGTTQSGDRWPVLTLYADGVATDSEVYVPDPHGLSFRGVSPLVWIRVGEPFAGVGGATYELELRGGFVDSAGNPAAGGADKLILAGVMLRESSGGNGNLYSDNVATGTDDGEVTTGFTALVGGETLASVTTQAHTGKRSLEVTPAVTTLDQGVYAAATATESVPHRASVWVYSSVGRDVSVFVRNDTTATDGTITVETLAVDTWTQVEVVSPDATAGDDLHLTVRDESDPAITTPFCIDTLEIYPL